YIDSHIGAIDLYVGGIARHTTKVHVHNRVDYLGAAILSAAVTALVLMLTWGGSQYAWDSRIIVVLGVATVVLLGLFVFIEQRVEEPILPLRLFHSSIFRVATAASTIVG